MNLSLLPYKPYRTVIINCGTKICSTLALMSALRHTQMPVLMIDCESTDGSFEYFRSLQVHYTFELISLPLRPHGETLDLVFKELNSDYIILVDSDVEILGDEIVEWMKKYIVHENVFGAGFLQMSEWIMQMKDGWKRTGYCMENPYTPLCILDRKHYLNALNDGQSFKYFEIKNTKESFVKKVYYCLANKLLHLKPENSLQFEINAAMYGKNDFLIAYDAGAKIYEYMRYQKRLDYVGIPHRLQGMHINHYQGVTRYLLNPEDRNFTTDMASIKTEIQDILLKKYGINMREG